MNYQESKAKKKPGTKKLSLNKKIKKKSTYTKDKSYSKKLFKLNKGTLSQFGYYDIKKMSKQERRKSLSKAVKNVKPLSVMRKLIALSILQKNTNKKLSKTFREDAKFVKTTKEYKKQSKTQK